MSVHIAPGHARHRHRDRTRARTRTGWKLPVVLGFLFALYAQHIERDGRSITFGIAMLGLVSGVVFGGLYYLLRRTQASLPRELRAAAYGALAGLGVGWLYSLSGASVLTAAGVSLVVAAGAGCVAFYAFYTHE
ncbi:MULTISPECIES: hypothetical protein [unclassified Streptomyces]|uniref:hypothetical protein n=1 Tax=unclassified Streptomyces TaxID=2593676 RepID=UPI0033B1D4BE